MGVCFAHIGGIGRIVDNHYWFYLLFVHDYFFDYDYMLFDDLRCEGFCILVLNDDTVDNA